MVFAIMAMAARAEPNVLEQLGNAVKGGTAALDLRYRFEMVDQDGFNDTAKASLLRTRLTLESAKAGPLSALLEIDDVSSVGREDYNSTENGKTRFPVIADPEGTEVNQAWLRYSNEHLDATFGRQRIVLDKGRFIGAKPWRQNEQTYDAARLQWQIGPGVGIDASYVKQVNRVFGPTNGSNPANWYGDSGFLRASYDLADGHEVTAFAYLVDVDPQSEFSAAQTVSNSSDTFGAAYAGEFSGLSVLARLATQTNAGGSEVDYRAPYYVVELGAPLGQIRLRVVYEVLGADNGVGFGTPLANGQAYQGWADMFLATPGDGIKDAWVSLDSTLGPLALTARYHDFSAESSGVRFGREIDLQARWVINDWFTATAKAAVFNSDSPARFADTIKAWLTLQLRL